MAVVTHEAELFSNVFKQTLAAHHAESMFVHYHPEHLFCNYGAWNPWINAQVTGTRFSA